MEKLFFSIGGLTVLMEKFAMLGCLEVLELGPMKGEPNEQN